jgi:spermidine synthase
VIPFQTIAQARLEDGSQFTLVRRGEEWVLRAGSATLMSSRTSASEVTLAEQTLRRVVHPRDVLVGGLGLGYTLRATLDRVAPETRVAVAELVPELVQWHEVHLGHLAEFPLKDPRCSVVIGDVLAHIQQRPRGYDAIMLDVDNGPSALSTPQNRSLYGDRGVSHCKRALRPGGVLAVWSQGPCVRYEQTLARAGMKVEVLSVGAGVSGRAQHVLFVASLPDKTPTPRRALTKNGA